VVTIGHEQEPVQRPVLGQVGKDQPRIALAEPFPVGPLVAVQRDLIAFRELLTERQCLLGRNLCGRVMAIAMPDRIQQALH
jgi:hypothetical protein